MKKADAQKKARQLFTQLGDMYVNHELNKKERPVCRTCGKPKNTHPVCPDCGTLTGHGGHGWSGKNYCARWDCFKCGHHFLDTPTRLKGIE